MGSYILKLSRYLICIYLFMFEIESSHVAPGGLGHAHPYCSYLPISGITDVDYRIARCYI